MGIHTVWQTSRCSSRAGAQLLQCVPAMVLVVDPSIMGTVVSMSMIVVHKIDELKGRDGVAGGLDWTIGLATTLATSSVAESPRSSKPFNGDKDIWGDNVTLDQETLCSEHSPDKADLI